MIVDHRVAGTRITVWDVLHHIENGWSLADTAEVFGLSVEQIQDAMDYILAHHAEVMKTHHEIEERNTQGNPPEVEEILETARARRLQWLMQRQETTAR
jgi:uncharacterized protein (DUF433 family)